jgi:hypothetical protein
MKKVFWSSFALLLTLALAGGAARARPEDKATQFDVNVGDALIEGIVGSPPGDVAKASTGDTIKVIFTGQIDVEDGAAEGKGTFEHWDSGGTLLEFGTFQAKRLISFTDFGTEADLPRTFHGGTALIRVRGVRYSADLQKITKFKATLKVDCQVGSPPPGLEEGITFAISGGPNFDMKVSGSNLFVATEENED